MEAAAEEFYLGNYLQAFTLADVATAYAGIPQVNVW